MTSSIPSSFQQPLYEENYDSARIEALKNAGNCREILYDKAIFWRVFCNSFRESNPNFGTLSSDHQMHVQYPLESALALQGIVEAIRGLFWNAVAKDSLLTFWVKERRDQIEIENIDDQYSEGPVILRRDFSFHNLIIALNVALESAGAKKIDFFALNNGVHRVDIEWKSNQVVSNMNTKKFFDERAAAQYMLIAEALGGSQAVRNLPVVEGYRDVELITAPVMRSVDCSFFVFRYLIRDEDQDMETVFHTALVNMLKVPSMATGENRGWVFFELDISEDYVGQIGPVELSYNAAHLELTCERIKKLTQGSPVGMLYHILRWNEDEELTSNGESAVELV